MVAILGLTGCGQVALMTSERTSRPEGTYKTQQVLTPSQPAPVRPRYFYGQLLSRVPVDLDALVSSRLGQVTVSSEAGYPVPPGTYTIVLERRRGAWQIRWTAVDDPTQRYTTAARLMMDPESRQSGRRVTWTLSPGQAIDAVDMYLKLE